MSLLYTTDEGYDSLHDSEDEVKESKPRNISRRMHRPN